MISLNDIKNIFSILINKKKLLIFESKKQYLEIFFEIEEILKKKNISFQSILVTDNKEIISSKIFNFTPKILFTLLKFCNDYEIFTSTPTINKKINNKSSYFFFQHSLLLNAHYTHKNQMNYFDKVYACSLDQYNYLRNIIDEGKILKYKFYHLDKFMKLKKLIINENRKTILIAPSFGKESLIHNLELNVFKELSKLFSIIIRPHPESKKYVEDLNRLDTIIDSSNNKNIFISKNSSNIQDINKSDFLLTDNSGIGITFAYLKNIPPIFVNINPNLNHKMYENYSKDFMSEIALVSSNNLKDLISKILSLSNNKQLYDKIQIYKQNQFRYFSKDNYQNLIIGS